MQKFFFFFETMLQNWLFFFLTVMVLLTLYHGCSAWKPGNKDHWLGNQIKNKTLHITQKHKWKMGPLCYGKGCCGNITPQSLPPIQSNSETNKRMEQTQKEIKVGLADRGIPPHSLKIRKTL